MRLIKYILISFLFIFSVHISFANGDIPAYYKVASLTSGMDNAVSSVMDALTANGFNILGNYSPADRTDFHVIAFTSSALQKITLKVEDRGALASILKVGFVKEGGRVDVSIVNPEYIFYAYLREDAEHYKAELDIISNEVKEALSEIGKEWTPFGGALEIKQLKKYHYMLGMPYFDDPVKLNEFSSFTAGVETIQKNLKSGKGNTVKVYELILESEEVAIFGVGLLDPEDGEGNFLPIIGPSHIAAMPYEIIIQGNQATILHGRFRYALHWPELTMGTFTKIMSTPGYVKDTMKGLTE